MSFAPHMEEANAPTQYGEKVPEGSRPEASRGLSSLDDIGGGVDNLANTLGNAPPSGRQQSSTTSTSAFAPNSSSPLASQSPISSSTASSGQQQSTTNPFQSGYQSSQVGESGLSLGGSSTSSTSGQSSGLNLGSASSQSSSSFNTGSSGSTTGPNASDPSLAQFTSNKLAQASDALGKASDKIAPSNQSTIDIGGAQTSSTGGATPGGVVKSQDHVENLVSAIGGILLSAPVAAAELVAGKTKQGVAVVQQTANERGLGDIAAQVQGHANNAVTQVRGADAPPLADSISAYASSAAQQASALVSSVSQQAQGLVQRSPLTDADGKPTTQNLPSSQGIASTVQGYAQSAAQSISGVAASVAQSAHDLTDRVGLTSPLSQDTNTAVKPQDRHFATADTDAPRAVLADSETPVNTSKSEVPSAAGASLSSADSYSSPQAATSLQPDAITQPKSAQYGEGQIGSGL